LDLDPSKRFSSPGTIMLHPSQIFDLTARGAVTAQKALRKAAFRHLIALKKDAIPASRRYTTSDRPAARAVPAAIRLMTACQTHQRPSPLAQIVIVRRVGSSPLKDNDARSPRSRHRRRDIGRRT
jgi:hypothetical protein